MVSLFGRSTHPRPSAARAVALLAVAVLVVSTATARVFLSRDEALRLAFGEDAEVERTSVFLTDDQIERARELAGPTVDVEHALVTRWIGTRDGEAIGVAYFDTHRVRTLDETIMVVVGPEGEVIRVEILAFHEPEDYLPRDLWIDQFNGRRLDSDLNVDRGIHGITGATLSAHAVTDATRRILAVHRVVEADANDREEGS